MQNEIKSKVNPMVWMTVFEDMEPKIRRWAFISAKMAERQQTFKAIGTRHRISSWYIGAQAQGRTPMTVRVIKALEADLKIDLAPFLSPEETFKSKWRKQDIKPKEEAI